MAKILVLLWVLVITTTVCAQFKIPDLTIEALKSGKVRVSLPNVEGLKLFAFHANINEPIKRQNVGVYSQETRSPDGDSWVLTFDMRVSKGDTIYYWVHVLVGYAGYVKEDAWDIKELKDAFTPLCKQTVTIVNGQKASCIGQVIFEDNFGGSQVERSKWLVQHRIPTYSGPNFEFNSYLDQDDTRFMKDDKLYLKPIPFTNANDVRGVLNLTDKCTSTEPHECVYIQKFSYILPPVKSAKITSNLSFKYGKIEIKAKLPKGDWIVPIIELEDELQTDGQNSAKVWIAFSRGNGYLMGNGPDDYGSRLLFGGPVVHPVEPIRSKHLASKYGSTPFNDDFHVYTLVWQPGKMILYVDNEVFGDISTERGFAEYSLQMRADWTEPEAPYNREYGLSLGAAVGGIYDFPDGFNSENDPKPWTNTERNYVSKFFDARDVWMQTWHGDDVALQVDYVKITAI